MLLFLLDPCNFLAMRSFPTLPISNLDYLAHVHNQLDDVRFPSNSQGDRGNNHLFGFAPNYQGGHFGMAWKRRQESPEGRDALIQARIVRRAWDSKRQSNGIERISSNR